jgi:hypothetical protein
MSGIGLGGSGGGLWGCSSLSPEKQIIRGSGGTGQTEERKTMKTKNLTLAEAIRTGLPCRVMEQPGEDMPRFGFKLQEELLYMQFGYDEATEPIWEVKREPRYWTMFVRGLEVVVADDLMNTQPPEGWEQIRMREVIE